MKKYEYQFIRVPRVVEKKGFLQTAPSGATFEACKEVIRQEAEKGWRFKQVVVPFHEKMAMYGSDGYEIIFEREAEEE